MKHDFNRIKRQNIRLTGKLSSFLLLFFYYVADVFSIAKLSKSSQESSKNLKRALAAEGELKDVKNKYNKNKKK